MKGLFITTLIFALALAQAAFGHSVVPCVGEGTSVQEFDNSGNRTCKTSTQTTISGSEQNGDMLVYDTDSFRDVPMSGHATMDETGAVTLALTFEECFPMYAPTAEIALDDDLQSIWRAPAALTITEVWCETDTGTVTMDLQIDGGAPADVIGTDLICDTDSEVSPGDAALAGDVTMADGDRLDWLIDSVASSPTRFTVCIEYSYD